MIEFFDNENFPYSLHYNDSNLLDITSYNNSLVLDMFDTIAYICYKDFYTKRDEDVNNKEKLSLEIPVENYEKFKKCKKKFEYLINYMTNGEKWNINFIQCLNKKEIISGRLPLEPSVKYNSISLLSGGLDALSGTVAEEENKTIYVTFGTNLIEASNAQKIYNKIIDKNKNANVYVKKVILNSEQHYTERTRSLMFIGCCLIFADFYSIKKIKIYENGIMSLNPKFNFSRRVTKTTNQKTIYLINEILSELGINVEVENPFRYLTKAQVISQIPKEYFEIISNETRTCSKNSGIIHFSNKSKGNFHCGLCIACILRQIGTINNNLYEEAVALYKDKFKGICQGKKTIGDYIVPKRGKNLLTRDAIDGDTPVVAGGIDLSAYHNQSNTKSPVITISASGANAGYTNLWNIPVWASDCSYIDDSITKNVYFWYIVLKTRQNEIFDAQTGSVQPHIYPQHIAEMSIGELNIAEVEKYNNLVAPLFKMIGENQKENKKLSQLRDTLLLKLMNGEIDLANIEI